MAGLIAGVALGARRLADGILALSFGTLLGSLIGLFGARGAILVPVLVVGAVMAAVPYSGLYALVAIVPVNVQITDTITVSRLAIVGAVGLTALQALTRRIEMPRFFLWPEGVATVTYFGLITYSSLVFGMSGLLSRLGPQIIYAAIFFVVMSQAADFQRFRAVLWVIVIGAVLQSLLVMAEALYGFAPFGGWHAELAADRGTTEVRVVGTHAHPITLAGYFQIAICAAVGLAATEKWRPLALPLVLSAGLFMVGWWYTYARSSWIGMVVMALAAMLVASRQTRALALVGGLFGFVLLSFYDFSLSAVIRDVESLATLRSASARAGVAEGSESLAWRIENWRAAIGIMLDHPVFGVGIDQSPRFMTENLPLGASAHAFIDVAVPHNMFLQIGSEAGIPTLAAFVLILVLAMRALYRAAMVPALHGYAVTVFAMICGQIATFSLNPMPREVWLTTALAFALGQIARAATVDRAGSASPQAAR